MGWEKRDPGEQKRGGREAGIYLISTLNIQHSSMNRLAIGDFDCDCGPGLQGKGGKDIGEIKMPKSHQLGIDGCMHTDGWMTFPISPPMKEGHLSLCNVQYNNIISVVHCSLFVNSKRKTE